MTPQRIARLVAAHMGRVAAEVAAERVADNPPSARTLAADAQEWASLKRRLEHALHSFDFSWATPVVRDIFSGVAHPPEEGTLSFALACRAVLRGYVDLATAELAQATALAQTALVAGVEASAPRLSAVVQRYVEQQARRRTWRGKGRKECARVLRGLLHAVGDVPFEQLDYRSARRAVVSGPPGLGRHGQRRARRQRPPQARRVALGVGLALGSATAPQLHVLKFYAWAAREGLVAPHAAPRLLRAARPRSLLSTHEK
jgi:hypothetical protein